MLLAKDRAGWARLTRLLTRGRLRCEKGSSTVSFREVCEVAAGLICLVPSAFLTHDDSARVAQELKDAFKGDVFAMPCRHRRALDGQQERALRDLELPVVAGSEVLYHTPARRRPARRPHLPAPRGDPRGCRRPHAPQSRIHPAFAARLPNSMGRRFCSYRNDARGGRSLPVRPRPAPLRLPLGTPARRPHLGRASALAHLRRRGRALPQRGPWPSPRAGRKRAQAHRGARLLRLLLDHARDRRLLREKRHSLPRSRLGGELGRVLLPPSDGRRPRARRPSL